MKKKPGMMLSILAGMPKPKWKKGMDMEFDEKDEEDEEDGIDMSALDEEDDLEKEDEEEAEDEDMMTLEDDEVLSEDASPAERVMKAIQEKDSLAFELGLEELISSILDKRK